MEIIIFIKDDLMSLFISVKIFRRNQFDVSRLPSVQPKFTQTAKNAPEIAWKDGKWNLIVWVLLFHCFLVKIHSIFIGFFLLYFAIFTMLD